MIHRIKNHHLVPSSNPAAEAERARIANDVALYLAQGGEIKHVPHDATGDGLKVWKRSDKIEAKI